MKLSRRHSLKTLTAAVASPLTAGPKTHNYRLIVLDVGGTLLEERGDVTGALRSALGRQNIVVSTAEIGPWRGASKRAVIQHFVEERSQQSDQGRLGLTDKIYQDFNAQINESYRGVPPIVGAEEAIRKLVENNYLVATTTGFDRQIVMPIFRRLGWERYFAAIVGSDEVSQGRPSPYMIFHAMETARVNNVAEVMAVGDTPLDLQAASNAGLRGIVGVLSGVGTAEKLHREPHTQILPSVANLPSLLGVRS